MCGASSSPQASEGTVRIQREKQAEVRSRRDRMASSPGKKKAKWPRIALALSLFLSSEFVAVKTNFLIRDLHLLVKLAAEDLSLLHFVSAPCRRSLNARARMRHRNQREKERKRQWRQQTLMALASPSSTLTPVPASPPCSPRTPKRSPRFATATAIATRKTSTRATSRYEKVRERGGNGGQKRERSLG